VRRQTVVRVSCMNASFHPGWLGCSMQHPMTVSLSLPPPLPQPRCPAFSSAPLATLLALPLVDPLLSSRVRAAGTPLAKVEDRI
jgi:hypothetical protein